MRRSSGHTDAADALDSGKPASVAYSFCDKPRTDTLRLAAGPGVYICAECTGLYTEILAES